MYCRILTFTNRVSTTTNEGIGNLTVTAYGASKHVDRRTVLMNRPVSRSVPADIMNRQCTNIRQCWSSVLLIYLESVFNCRSPYISLAFGGFRYQKTLTGTNWQFQYPSLAAIATLWPLHCFDLVLLPTVGVSSLWHFWQCLFLSRALLRLCVLCERVFFKRHRFGVGRFVAFLGRLASYTSGWPSWFLLQHYSSNRTCYE